MLYLLKRGLQMIVILMFLSAGLFGILTLMPGNPIDLMITSNPNIKPEDVVRLKKLRGLDKPWYIQYFRWLVGYPEPARPPEIVQVPPVYVTDGVIDIDVSPNISDPNFVPEEEQLISFLSLLVPNYQADARYHQMPSLVEKRDISEIAKLLLETEPLKQKKFLTLIKKESRKNLTVQAIGKGRAMHQRIVVENLKGEQDFVWFIVRNSYGQETLGKIPLVFETKTTEENPVIAAISTQEVQEEQREFKVDLKKFLLHSDQPVTFDLLTKENGTLAGTIFTMKFDKPGQKSAVFTVIDEHTHKFSFGFNVAYGVVGHESRYNRGFMYLFAGDKNALGFSQTYKRPIYVLLFGEESYCGNSRKDPGETCDFMDPKAQNCTKVCFKKTDTFIEKAKATIVGWFSGGGKIANTVALMLPALLLSLIIAIPLGVISAYRQYSVLDYVLNFLAFVGISLPVFWFGIMMMYLFAEIWPIFPAGGIGTPGLMNDNLSVFVADKFKHAFLPTIVLSIFYIGRWLRYMRASMLEVLPQDYVRTARAKGLSEFIVVTKHAFRNALIPVVTVLAISIPALFGGAVLTETVFSWPGIGRLQYDAVMNSDYYVAIVVFLISAILVMFGNLLADVVYLIADPRIRKE